MSRHHGDARLDHLVLLLRALAKTDWHRFYFQSALWRSCASRGRSHAALSATTSTCKASV